MSNLQTLRALVTERLAAAAEDVLVLFERTIVEYEEELCRCKEENQRKLDKVQFPNISLVRGNFQVPPTSPGPSLDQDLPKTPRIKEEQSLKQEQEQLPVCVPEYSAVCVEPEESLQQNEETQREDDPNMSVAETTVHNRDVSETTVHNRDVSETTVHNRDVSETTVHNRDVSETTVHNRDVSETTVHNRDVSETTVHNRDMSETTVHNRDVSETTVHNRDVSETTVHNRDVSVADEAEETRHQCPLCPRSFQTTRGLRRHFRVHYENKALSSSVCVTAVNVKQGALTNGKSFICTVCNKGFVKKQNLKLHLRTHTGERPFACPVCGKRFFQKPNCDLHMRIHTGERPYKCSVCGKDYIQKPHLNIHMRTHTGERPYVCTICGKRYNRKWSHSTHMKTHTREKPHSLSQNVYSET